MKRMIEGKLYKTIRSPEEASCTGCAFQEYAYSWCKLNCPDMDGEEIWDKVCTANKLGNFPRLRTKVSGGAK